MPEKRKKEAERPPYNCACKPGSVPVSGSRPSIFALRYRKARSCLLPPSGLWRGTAGTRGVPPKGVASDRVYMASHVTAGSVSSYLAFPSLPHKAAVYFCCTFPGVTPGGRYPLSSPVKPGLSSRYYLSAPYRAAAPHTCPLIIHCRAHFVKPRRREKVAKTVAFCGGAWLFLCVFFVYFAKKD